MQMSARRLIRRALHWPTHANRAGCISRALFQRAFFRASIFAVAAVVWPRGKLASVGGGDFVEDERVSIPAEGRRAHRRLTQISLAGRAATC